MNHLQYFMGLVFFSSVLIAQPAPIQSLSLSETALVLRDTVNRARALYPIPAEVQIKVVEGDPYIHRMMHVINHPEGFAFFWTQRLAVESDQLRRIFAVQGLYIPTPAFYNQLSLVRAVFTNAFAAVTIFQQMIAETYTIPTCWVKNQRGPGVVAVQAIRPADVEATLIRMQQLKWHYSKMLAGIFYKEYNRVIPAQHIAIGNAGFPNPGKIPGFFCPQSFYQHNRWDGEINFGQNIGTVPHLPFYPSNNGQIDPAKAVPYVDPALAPNGYQNPQLPAVPGGVGQPPQGGAQPPQYRPGGPGVPGMGQPPGGGIIRPQPQDPAQQPGGQQQPGTGGLTPQKPPAQGPEEWKF